MKTKILLIFSILSLMISSYTPANSSDIQKAFSPEELMKKLVGAEAITKDEQIGFTVVADSRFPITTKLSKQPPGVREGEVRGSWQDCASTSDPICNIENAGYNGVPGQFGIVGWTILPKCESNTSTDCLESLEISYEGKDYESAQFVRGLNSPNIPSDDSRNYIGGGSVGLWNDSKVSNFKSFNYMVTLGYGMSYEPSRKTFDITELNVSIRPYKEVIGNYEAPKFRTFSDGSRGISNSSPLNGEEIWLDDSKAGILIDFPTSSKFRVKARVSNSLSGWFKGRLKDPQVSITPISKDHNALVVEGEPVVVPSFLHIKKRSEMTSKENQWRQNNGGTWSITNATSYQWDIFEYLDHFRPLVNDKAAGVNSFWSLNSTNWGNNNQCLADKDRVVGIVSTNAMGYDGSSPKYENGTLNYQVAGMHYMPDGKTLVEGTYDLLMRSDAARCLYGFSQAPVQATISITGDQEQKVAVTSMKEGNGWMKLSAYGFNFSSPKIQVKLTQEKPAETPEVQVSSRDVPMAKQEVAAPVIKPSPKKSITCVKGKTTKKVVAVNPKCPAGYKKK